MGMTFPLGMLINYAINLFCYLLALTNTYITAQCLFPMYLGPTAQKLLYETDAVLGVLLGVPKNLCTHSKIQSCLLLLAAYGQLTIAHTDQFANFLSILFMQFSNIYYFLIVIYLQILGNINDHRTKLNAKFRLNTCLLLIFINLLCIVYKAKYYLSFRVYGYSFVNFTVISIILGCLCAISMMQRAPKCKKLIIRWRRIDKFCLENCEFVWLECFGRPEGFVEFGSL